MDEAKAALRQKSEGLATDGAQFVERAGETAHRVSDQAALLAHAIAEQAASSVVAGAERAREVSSSIAAAAREKGPQVGQVSSQISHKVSDEVVPSLRDIALQAASLALELWQTTRERASEAAGAAQHELEHIVPAAAHAVDAAERRAGEATALVAERTEEVIDRARHASRQAVDTTVDTGKDTGALLFWGGAAAGLVFYALLSHERRDQILKTADTVFTQVRELVRDFQGYDEEFA